MKQHTDGDWIFTIEDKQAVIAGYQGRGHRVLLVPSKLGGRQVTRIGARAFAGHYEIDYVILPENIIEIGDKAFERCGLKNLKIPKAIRKVGVNPFWLCKSLNAIQVEAGNTCFESMDGVLYGCDGEDHRTLICYPMGKRDRTFAIPERVSIIGEYAFYGCLHLEEVTLRDDVIDVEPEAFEGCSQLEKVQLSQNLKTIGQEAFAGCWSLKRIIIPGAIVTLEKSAFAGCYGLSDVHFTSPTAFTTYYLSVLSGCEALENVVLPEGIKTLEIDDSVMNLSPDSRDREVHVHVPRSVETVRLYEGEYLIGKSVLPCKAGQGYCFHIPKGTRYLWSRRALAQQNENYYFSDDGWSHTTRHKRNARAWSLREKMSLLAALLQRTKYNHAAVKAAGNVKLKIIEEDRQDEVQI